MTEVRSRVEYLRGLSEGLGLDTESKEGKMITEMLQVIGQLAQDLGDLASDQEDLETYLDVVDSDLQDLEDDFYGAPDFVAGDVEEEEVGREEAYEEQGETGALTTYACPNCGARIPTPVAGGPVSIADVEPEDELTDLPFPTKE